jgi:Spy/CpxP family protein refolding chaperone
MTPFYNRPSFPWILVLLLIGINIGLMVFLWAGNGHKPPKPRGEKIMVEEILGMDEKQRISFKEIQDAHFAVTDSMRSSLRAQRDSAFQQLKGGNPDSVAVNRHLSRLGAITQAIETEIFNHFMEVRAACTPAQVPKFDGALLEEILHRRHRNGPPPR